VQQHLLSPLLCAAAAVVPLAPPQLEWGQCCWRWDAGAGGAVGAGAGAGAAAAVVAALTAGAGAADAFDTAGVNGWAVGPVGELAAARVGWTARCCLLMVEGLPSGEQPLQHCQRRQVRGCCCPGSQECEGCGLGLQHACWPTGYLCDIRHTRQRT